MNLGLHSSDSGRTGQERMSMDPKDIAILTLQLRRPPRAIAEVVTRCGDGHPAVIRTPPLAPDKHGVLLPMPTLYWLTCPALRRAVSRIEERGAVSEFEARIASDPEFRSQYLEAHERYRATRSRTMTEADRALIEAQGFAEAFASRGIGGLGNPLAVKCLHLHLAHHLAEENPIGRVLIQEMGVQLCP